MIVVNFFNFNLNKAIKLFGDCKLLEAKNNYYNSTLVPLKCGLMQNNFMYLTGDQYGRLCFWNLL